MMWLLGAALSFVLDLLLGDPEKLLHPVVVMGKAISRLEKILRAGFPKTPRGERAAGFVLALLLPVGTLAVTSVALWAVGLIHPILRFALGIFWGWQALALKGLNTESKRVYTALTTGTIEEARKAVSRIVGRDTQRLDEAGVTVGERDSLNYETDKPLFDKMHIRVTRVMDVQITADGETKAYETSAQTVEDALEKCGVQLGEEDRVEPALTEKVKDGMEITVRRVEVKEEVQTEEVAYETEYQDTASLYEGETQVKTEGVPGEKEVTYKVTYVDGEEESREAASEKVTKEPVAEVVLRGTSQKEEASGGVDVSGGNGTGNVAGTFVDMYGNTVSYSSMMSGTCTAYSVPGGTTSLGWDAVYGVVAVNPNIIPYGTKMYITSPDGSVVYGYGVAGDTGGAVMAGDILADLCYNTLEECSQIGRRTMNIYILS